MVQQLTGVAAGGLLQICELVRQITDQDYSLPLDLLSSNSISKHVRHVLEMYNELLDGLPGGTIDYDARKRNPLIEQDRSYTNEYIRELIKRLGSLASDRDLNLVVRYVNEEPPMLLPTSLSREISYNIEHAIHHMAIMQICIREKFPYIIPEPGFGIAFSTRNYWQQHVHTHLPAR